MKSKFIGTPAASGTNYGEWRILASMEPETVTKETEGESAKHKVGDDTPPSAEGCTVKMPSTAPGGIPWKLFPLSHTKIEVNLMKFSRIKLHEIHVTQYSRTHVKRVCT